MAVVSTAVEVTDEAAVVLNAAGGSLTTGEIVNPSSNTVTVYIGGADVTTANGRPVAPGESFAIDLKDDNDDVYAVAASAVTVRCLVLT